MGAAMYGKRIGEPCPKCASLLIPRAKRMIARGGGSGDMAFCPRCSAAYELAEPDHDLAAFALKLGFSR